MFRFRLQRVLELRETTEKQAAVRLATSREEAAAAHEATASLETLRERSARGMSIAHGAASTAGQLQNFSYMVEHLNRQIQEAHSVAAAADENVARLLGEFTAAFRDRRMLDRLRDRQHEDWKAEAVQADRQTMDDIALSRFVRQPASTSAAE